MKASTKTVSCPSCELPVLPVFYFCPNCGKQLRARPIVVSVPKQLGVYILSFLLPPFGLYPAIKYIRQSNTKTKIIGWVAIALTIIAMIISYSAAWQFLQVYSQQLQLLSNPQLY